MFLNTVKVLLPFVINILIYYYYCHYFFVLPPQYGMSICENTEPVGVECRVAATQGAIPTGVVCDLSGLQCIAGRNIPANDTCPDMEIRYRCARSRGENEFRCFLLLLFFSDPLSAEVGNKIMMCVVLCCCSKN